MNAQDQQCDQCGAGSEGLDPQFESFDTIPNLRGPEELSAPEVWRHAQSSPSTTLLFSPRQVAPMIKGELGPPTVEGATSRGRGRGEQAELLDEEAALEPIFDQTMSEFVSDDFDEIDAPDDMTALEEYVGGLESFDGELPELAHAASFELSGQTEVSLLPSVALEALESPLPDPIDDLDEFTQPSHPKLDGSPHQSKGPPPLTSSPLLTRTNPGPSASRQTPHHRLILLNHAGPSVSTPVTPHEHISVNHTELTWESESPQRFKVNLVSRSGARAPLEDQIWRAIKGAELLELNAVIRCQTWRFVVCPSKLSELSEPNELQDPTLSQRLSRQDTEGYLTSPGHPSHRRSELSTTEPQQRALPMLMVYRLDHLEPRLYGAFPLREGVNQIGIGAGDIALPSERRSPHVLFSLSHDQRGIRVHSHLVDVWRALGASEEVAFGSLLAVRDQVFSLLRL